MTITLPETTTEIGLELLEDLDFDPELPCEHRQHAAHPYHGGAGEVHIRRHPPCGCDGPPSLLLCRKSWEAAGAFGVHCSKCFLTGTREDFWTAIGGTR